MTVCFFSREEVAPFPFAHATASDTSAPLASLTVTMTEPARRLPSKRQLTRTTSARTEINLIGERDVRLNEMVFVFQRVVRRRGILIARLDGEIFGQGVSG